MAVKPRGTYSNVVNMAGTRLADEELEKRRSAVITVAPVVGATPELSVADLRDRYCVLLSARENDPDLLTTRALYVFECHQKVAMEFGADYGEEVYQDGTTGHLMRQRLRELCPIWFEE